MTLMIPEGEKMLHQIWLVFLSFFKIWTKLLWFCFCCNFFLFFYFFLSVPYIFIYKDMNIFISDIGGYNVDSIDYVSFSFTAFRSIAG